MRTDTQQRAKWANDWLSSDDPVQVAWGAWFARHDDRKDLIPSLLRKVEDYQPLGDSAFEGQDGHDATLVVLDALIGLHARVAPVDARKLYPEFPAQSVILLVRDGSDAQSALLEILDSATANSTWLAAGNVLTKYRTAGFAARLLTGFTQHLNVSVVDPNFGIGGGVGGRGGECGFSMGSPKVGWPPVGLYLLSQIPELLSGIDATFLVGGDTPVCCFRSAPGSYDNPSDIPGACHDGNRDVYRAQYLKRLTDPSYPPMDIDAYPIVTIEWKGEDDYKAQLFALVEQRQRAFKRIVNRLLEMGTLTSGECRRP